MVVGEKFHGSNAAHLLPFFGQIARITYDLLSIYLIQASKPLNTTISDYIIGPFGWLEKAGNLLVSISSLLLGVNLLANLDLLSFLLVSARNFGKVHQMVS